MREIRQSGSEGGGAGYSTGPPYPYFSYSNVALSGRKLLTEPRHEPVADLLPRGGLHLSGLQGRHPSGNLLPPRCLYVRFRCRLQVRASCNTVRMSSHEGHFTTSERHACYSGCMAEPPSRDPAPPAPFPPEESPDGVDLTLIQWTLSLTPLERLELLQDWVDGLAEFGHGRASER